jgi:23S rRNA (uracil1939-C5)-methyltransferase
VNRIEIDSVASGGEGIGRLDGKAVFVPGAIPGDLVDVELILNKKRFARGRLMGIERASVDRIEMPCRHAELCGGCSWQMVERSIQTGWKQQAVADALVRIGRIDHIKPRPILAPGPDYGYRNRLDLHPSEQGPGFHQMGSHELVVVQECLLAAPAVVALLDEVRGQPAAGDLTLRAGLRTGEAVIIGEGHADPGDAVITEIVAGVRFQVSGRAFFQPNTDGADLLVGLVDEAAGTEGGTFVDVFAGGGLFAGTVGSAFDDVVAIESSRRAVGDLRQNVPDATVLAMPALAGLKKLGEGADVLVVDPPREGLGPETVAALVAARPKVIVSVSCDVGTFSRDARMLIDAGYDFEWIQPVDQFPQTPHIETVARFARVRD